MMGVLQSYHAIHQKSNFSRHPERSEGSRTILRGSYLEITVLF